VCGGYLWPARFLAQLNITYYITAVLYSRSGVLTSTGIGNGKARYGSVAYKLPVLTGRQHGRTILSYTFKIRRIGP